MFINRKWSLSEEEDFKQNILLLLGKLTEAMPIYHNGGSGCIYKVFGWKIQSRYE